ncbi:MAG TPA: glycosyltransferase family 87 protein [Candidatus Desulfaltia sp.]|nr:glycosyltransferase family 87 protein [Candidatus Desulfaltia sp.]
MAVSRSTLFFALIALILCTLVFTLRVKKEMADFEVNYQAGQRLYEGETLYRTSDGHWQFKYLPFSALLYLPLSFLPLGLAKACWFGLIVAASVSIIVISSKLIDYKYDTFFSPVFVTVLVMGRYLFREVQLGQINALITFLLLVMIWFLVRSESRSAVAAGGAIGGLATALKPYAVIVFPYFAIRKRWPALVTGSAVLSLAVLSPALFYGWKGNLIVLGEWRSSLAASTPFLFSSQDNISLVGFLMKRTHNQNLSLIVYAIIVVLLGGLVLFLLLRGRRVSRASALDGFLILALIPLVSPLGWDYTFLSFAPAVMLICRHYGEYRPFWKGFLVMNLLVISLSLHDLMGHRLYATFMSWSILTLNFSSLVGYLAYLRIKGHA